MAQQDKTPKFPTWRPKSAGMTVAQKRQAALDAQKPKAKAPAKKPNNRTYRGGTLEEVTVMSPKKEKDTRTQTAMTRIAPRAMPKAAIDSSRVALPKLQAPATNKTAAGPKKLGRVATFMSDLASPTRAALNVARSKTYAKTGVGKVVERIGRTGAGVTFASQALPVTAAVGLPTAIVGQIGYKNRSAESTRRGLFNPGIKSLNDFSNANKGPKKKKK